MINAILVFLSAVLASGAVLSSQTECSLLLPKVRRMIQAKLRLASPGFLLQEGKVEFTGGSSATSSTCSSGSRKTQRSLSCSFQNPSSPYGLIQLPESPGKSQKSISYRSATTNNSPMTQMRFDESILLFGCLPPANASRYFSATGYLYSLFDNSTSKWVNTFASLGDSLHVIRQPISNYGLKRINASLPSDQSSTVRVSSGPLLLGGVSRSRGWVPLWQSGVKDGVVTASSGGPPPLPPTGFDAFTAILLTADPRQGDALTSILRDVLQANGIENAINVLPIPRPTFSDAIGLETLSSYFMLLLRNILPSSSDAKALWGSYLSSSPWSVLRLTPAIQDLKALSPGYPLPIVIPREPPASVNQSENWLQPAFDDLLRRLEAKVGAGNALAWSTGSSSYLSLLDVDWGIDCVANEIDVCQGDNRDATYISSFPFIQLDKEDKDLWLIGVNHVATGSSTWLSVSLTDPIAKAGLEAFDDDELAGSADQLMRGSIYSNLSPYLFAVRFARDCSNFSKYCKVIPTSGSKSLPKNRVALAIMRAYVNSATGVGPKTDHMITFRTLVVTPSSEARSYDTLPMTSGVDLKSSPCAVDMLKASTCFSGSGKYCCEAVASFNIGGCYCSADGQRVLDLLPSGIGKAAMMGANVLCGTRSNVNC